MVEEMCVLSMYKMLLSLLPDRVKEMCVLEHVQDDPAEPPDILQEALREIQPGSVKLIRGTRRRSRV